MAFAGEEVATRDPRETKVGRGPDILEINLPGGLRRRREPEGRRELRCGSEKERDTNGQIESYMMPRLARPQS